MNGPGPAATLTDLHGPPRRVPDRCMGDTRSPAKEGRATATDWDEEPRGSTAERADAGELTSGLLGRTCRASGKDAPGESNHFGRPRRRSVDFSLLIGGFVRKK